MKTSIFLVIALITLLVLGAGCQKQIGAADSGTANDDQEGIPTSGSADSQSLELVDENPVEIGELY